MKIAMIGQKGIPAHECGVAQWVEVVSRELVSRGHEVIAYCRHSYCGRDARSSSEGGLHRVFRPSVPTKHLDAITHTLACTIDVALRRADVVHFHCVGPALMAPLARLAGLPVVVTVHGLDYQRAKWSGFARWCLRQGERVAVRWANRLAVVSPTLQDYFASQYNREVEFVPNGVIPFPDTDLRRLADWKLTPGGYLLAVARLVPEKGLHYLIEAFQRTSLDLKLVFAGGCRFDDSYEKQLRQMADHRVVFTGMADRNLLAQLYAGARMFVLPSDLEGMSLALLEAMNAHLPVLVSDIPENVCVIGDAGFTFRRGDVADLQHVLTQVVDDRQLLQKYGRLAAQQVLPFQWPQIALQMEQLYARCAGIQLPTSAVRAGLAESPAAAALNVHEIASV